MGKQALLGTFLFGGFLFLFPRLFFLSETLYFWGDIGRDHQVLIEMLQEMKPVLLGPGNSQITFNQSAWYYYINLPVFLLSGYSAYTTAITGVLLNLAAFVVAYLLVRENNNSKEECLAWLVFFLLCAAQPLILSQQRLTWNPSFALPFVLIMIMAWWKSLHRYVLPRWTLPVLGISAAFALGMTYTVFPLVGILMLLLFVMQPGPTRKELALWTALGFTVVFLPHLIFELRYDFTLTRALLSRDAQQPAQDLISKLLPGLSYLWGWKDIAVGLPPTLISTVLFGSLVIKEAREGEKHLGKGGLVAFVSFAIVWLVVGTFHTHYILSLSLFILFLISRITGWPRLLFTGYLLLCWIPVSVQEFRITPHRRVRDLEACAQQFCSTHQQPLYVAAQAWHDYHSGYDYSFFMNKHGCMTRDIITNPGFSDQLAVVTDRALLDETTSFHELTLFGPRELQESVACGNEVSVHLFQHKR